MKNGQQEILDFWFKETQPQQWFQKNEEFDAKVKENFLETYEMARKGFLDDWKQDADGCLALIIILDQFPRNMFRKSAQSYATDGQALLVAKYAVSKGFDQILEPVKRGFLYLPFQHSESLSDQKRSLELFEKMKDDNPMGHEYAKRHYSVIEQYGRFPHRNEALDRTNTSAEEDYLAQPNAGF